MSEREKAKKKKKKKEESKGKKKRKMLFIPFPEDIPAVGTTTLSCDAASKHHEQHRQQQHPFT